MCLGKSSCPHFVDREGLELNDVAEGGEVNLATSNGEVSNRCGYASPIDRDGLVYPLRNGETVQGKVDDAIVLKLIF
jgi:hypothetical protein